MLLSANKGGVTSSSLEVLAAMALTDEEFDKMMTVKGETPPEFYSTYVAEVQRIIEKNAKLEFECLWRHKQKTGMFGGGQRTGSGVWASRVHYAMVGTCFSH